MTTGLAKIASQSIGAPKASYEYQVAKTSRVPDGNIRKHVDMLLYEESLRQRLADTVTQLREILRAVASTTVTSLLALAQPHFPNAEARVIENEQWAPSSGMEFARIVLYYGLPDEEHISEQIAEHHAAVRDAFVDSLPSPFGHLFVLDRRLNSPL